jgi:hypothetical protein
MNSKNALKQMVLMRTDAHDVGGEPAEQWIGSASACAFMLLKELVERNSPYPQEIALKEALTDVVFNIFKWSKWDFRSRWYMKAVGHPVLEYPPVEKS